MRKQENLDKQKKPFDQNPQLHKAIGMTERCQSGDVIF